MRSPFFGINTIIALALALVLLGGCGATGTLNKPTTPSNAGGYALMTYSAAGIAAGFYFKLPLCASPAVYPCKTKAINDRLDKADKAAHDAAIAADDAVNDPGKQKAANETLKELTDQVSKPEVKSQVDLARAKAAGRVPS